MDELETGQKISTRLPARMTATIGRAEEISTLSALLRQEDTRLVTLTGPGGVGKTRLSLEVSRALLADFSHGVYFVSLAPLRELGQIILAITQALGLKETSEHALEGRLLAYLANKECLLLLDNFEHLLHCAYLVSELLNYAPQLKIVVTSREMLHLYGEREIIVSPLDLPDLITLNHVASSTAMSLFVERAQAARPGFVVNDENRRAIAEICVQLDGLPLAIELAAARCKLLSPQAILARLNSRLSLLTGGARDLPVRQQTLRNALDWSYDLLNEAEQACFRRLGIFIGSWTIEATTAVMGVNYDALDLLTSLVDKSLVRPVEDEAGETRFLLLETIREYALDCLNRHNEYIEARDLHATFYLQAAETVAPLLQGAEQRTGLRQLDQEAANLWAALSWLIEQRELTKALRLASALREYLPLRSSLSQGRQWLEEVLALEGARLESVLASDEGRETSILRARILYGAGALARMQSKLDLARTRLTESREIAQQVDDHITHALALGLLAQLELYPGNYAAARALVEEGLQASERSQDSWCKGILHRSAGNVASKQCDFASAQTRYSVSLTLLRAVGDQRNEAETLVNLGSMMRLRGKLKTAHYLYARGLRLFQEINDRWGQLACLNCMGEALCVEGQYSQARGCFEESRALASQSGAQAELTAALAGLGQVALCLDEQVIATRYLKEARRLAREINYTQGLVNVLCSQGDLERLRGNWSDALLSFNSALELARTSEDRLVMIAIFFGLGDTARALHKHAQACAWLKQSLDLAWEIGNHVALTSALEALAWLCQEIGQPEHGALLLGAAQELRDTLQTPRAPAYQAMYTTNLNSLRAAIGPETLREAWSEGRSLLLKQVMTAAVAQVHVLETAATATQQKQPASIPYNLTARELEVLHLLAAGHPDTRIAQALIVSPRTINTHLRSIYAKLGVSSRSAATRIAIEQKLVIS